MNSAKKKEKKLVRYYKAIFDDWKQGAFGSIVIFVKCVEKACGFIFFRKSL